MNVKKLASVLLTVSTLATVFAPATAQAHDDDVVIGALIGGIAGAAIGNNMGGQDSALVGAAIGGLAGAAIGSSNSRYEAPHPVAYRRAPVVYAAVPPAPVRYVPVVYTPEQVTFPQTVVYQDRHEWRERRHGRQGWRGHEERRAHGWDHDRGRRYFDD
jgi:uncharacterized protein YcfJ